MVNDPKVCWGELEKKKRGVLEQVPMMREETFCDIFLLVSIIKSTIYMHYFQPWFQKDMHVREEGNNSYLNLVDCFKQLDQFFSNIVPYLSSVGYCYFKAKPYFDNPTTFAVMCT